MLQGAEVFLQTFVWSVIRRNAILTIILMRQQFCLLRVNILLSDNKHEKFLRVNVIDKNIFFSSLIVSSSLNKILLYKLDLGHGKSLFLIKCLWQLINWNMICLGCQLSYILFPHLTINGRNMVLLTYLMVLSWRTFQTSVIRVLPKIWNYFYIITSSRQTGSRLIFQKPSFLK